LGNACFVCVDDGRFDPQNRLGLDKKPGTVPAWWGGGMLAFFRS
jgi:hypothetical protein